MAPKVITEITKVKLNSTLKLRNVSSGHSVIFCNIINIDFFVLSNGKKMVYPAFTIYYSFQLYTFICQFQMVLFL